MEKARINAQEVYLVMTTVVIIKKYNKMLQIMFPIMYLYSLDEMIFYILTFMQSSRVFWLKETLGGWVN